MVHRLGGIGALSSHNCKLQPLLGCMLVQDLFTTQFVPNRDATPTSWRRVNDSGRHPIPVGAVVVHRQSGDKLGQLRFRHCGSGGHRIRKRMHGARTVRARCAHGSGNTPLCPQSASITRRSRGKHCPNCPAKRHSSPSDTAPEAPPQFFRIGQVALPTLSRNWVELTGTSETKIKPPPVSTTMMNPQRPVRRVSNPRPMTWETSIVNVGRRRRFSVQLGRHVIQYGCQ